MCDREGEKGETDREGGHCLGLCFAFDVPEILIEITRFLDLFIFSLLPLLLFCASSRCPHFSHVILTALCACVPLRVCACVCVPEFVGFAFHLLILACISFLYAKCAKCHKFYGQRACKTQKRKATTTVSARRLVGVCVCGEGGEAKLPQFFWRRGRRQKVMKFVFGLFSFLCEFLLRRRRLRKAREIERGKEKERRREEDRKTCKWCQNFVACAIGL